MRFLRPVIPRGILLHIVGLEEGVDLRKRLVDVGFVLPHEASDGIPVLRREAGGSNAAVLIQDEFRRVVPDIGLHFLPYGIREHLRININPGDQAALDDIARDLQIRRGSHPQEVLCGSRVGRALGQNEAIGMEQQVPVTTLREGERSKILARCPLVA